VLLVFGAPSQLPSLAGLEHGRTIPLPDIDPAISKATILDRSTPSRTKVWPDKMTFLTLGADMARPSRTGGKTSAAKARRADSVKGRNPGKTKRRIAPTAIRLKRSPVSSVGKELKEAREQQAATAEILKAIASSPSDAQPVFQAIAEHSKRLLAAHSTAVYRFVDDISELAAFSPVSPAADAVLQAAFPRPTADHPMFELVRDGKVAEKFAYVKG